MKTKNENVILLRSKNVSIEQMCAALPILFEEFELDAIEVMPFPVMLEDENGNGSGLLTLVTDRGPIFMDYDAVLKGFKKETMQ